MAVRFVVGWMRYGEPGLEGRVRYDHVGRILQEVEAYRKTGDPEALVEIATHAMMAYADEGWHRRAWAGRGSGVHTRRERVDSSPPKRRTSMTDEPKIEDIKERMKSILTISSTCLRDPEVVLATKRLMDAALEESCAAWCLGQEHLPTLGDYATEKAWGIALASWDDAHRDWIFAMDRALDRAAKR